MSFCTKGRKGEQGVIGFMGTVGFPGDLGPIGPKGDRGLTGKCSQVHGSFLHISLRNTQLIQLALL